MKKSFKPGALLSPVPAVMVSLGEGEEQNIITIAWTGIINSDPPITYISVRKSRYSHDIIEKTGEFVINLTTEKLAFATDYCGVKSGRDVNKFEEMNLTPAQCDEVKCPMIKEAPINLECRVLEMKEYPTHHMFIAEIVAVHVDEEIVDEKGKIDYAKAKLISYVHGEYFGLRKTPLGSFGYSIMKAKTKKKKSKEAHEERVQKNREKREASEQNKAETASKAPEKGKTVRAGSKPKHAKKRTSPVDFAKKKEPGRHAKADEKQGFRKEFKREYKKDFKKDYDKDFSGEGRRQYRKKSEEERKDFNGGRKEFGDDRKSGFDKEKRDREFAKMKKSFRPVGYGSNKPRS